MARRKRRVWPYVVGGLAALGGGLWWWFKRKPEEPGVAPQEVPAAWAPSVFQAGERPPITTQFVADMRPGTLEVTIGSPRFILSFDEKSWDGTRLDTMFNSGTEMSWSVGYKFLSGWLFQFDELAGVFSAPGLIVSTPAEYQSGLLKLVNPINNYRSLPGQHVYLLRGQTGKWWKEVKGSKVSVSLLPGDYYISQAANAGPESSTFKFMTGLWKMTTGGPEGYSPTKAFQKVVNKDVSCHSTETQVKLTIGPRPLSGVKKIRISPVQKTSVTIRPTFVLAVGKRKYVQKSGLEAYYWACKGGTLVLGIIGNIIRAYISGGAKVST